MDQKLLLLHGEANSQVVDSVVEGQRTLGYGWTFLADMFRLDGLQVVASLDYLKFYEEFQAQAVLGLSLLTDVKKLEEKAIGKKLVKQIVSDLSDPVKLQYRQKFGLDISDSDLGQKQRAIVVIADSQLLVIRALLKKLQHFLKHRSAEFQQGLGKGPFLVELMRRQIGDLYDLLIYFEKLLESMKFFSRQAFQELKIDLVEIDQHFFRFDNLLKAIHLTAEATSKSPRSLIDIEVVRQICADMEMAPYDPADLEKLNKAGTYYESLQDVDKAFRIGKLALLETSWYNFLNYSELDEYGFLLASKLNDALQDEEIEQAELLTMMAALYQNQIDTKRYISKKKQFKKYQDVEVELKQTRRKLIPIALLPTARSASTETSTTESTSTTEPGDTTRR